MIVLFDILLINISVLLRKWPSEYSHIIRVSQEYPSIYFSLKDKEATLFSSPSITENGSGRKSMSNVRHFWSFCDNTKLLNLEKFTLINFKFLIINCIIRSSDLRNCFFLTITERHWGWWKSNGSMWHVTVVYQELFENSFFKDFTKMAIFRVSSSRRKKVSDGFVDGSSWDMCCIWVSLTAANCLITYKLAGGPLSEISFCRFPEAGSHNAS